MLNDMMLMFIQNNIYNVAVKLFEKDFISWNYYKNGLNRFILEFQRLRKT